MRRLRLASAVAIGLCTATSAFAADTHKVKLDHPFIVGQKYQVTVKATMKTSTAEDGGDPTNAEFKVDLAGVMTVDAVTDADKGSQPSKYTFKVDKCEKDGQGMVAAGAVVKAENSEGHTKITVDGKEPEEEYREALDLVFNTADPEEKGDDAEFGTKKPQAVGDSWDIDPEAVAEALVVSQLPFEDKDLKGTSTLKSVEDGVETVDTKITGVIDNRKLQNGGKIVHAELKSHEVKTVTEDEADVEGTDKSTYSLKMTVEMNGRKTESTMKATQTVTVKAAK